MAIKDIRTADGETYRLDEWLDWSLYSTVEAAAGIPVDLSLFAYIVGQRVTAARGAPAAFAARGAVITDTNQVQRKKMGWDEAYIAFAMTYEVFAIEGGTNANAVFPVPPLDDAALAPQLLGTNHARLKRDLIFSLKVGAGISKPMAAAPLSYIGQAFGSPAWASGDALTIAVGAATALNLNYGTGGAVSPRNVRRWRLPVKIDSARVMDANLRSPGSGPGTGALSDVNQDWQFRGYLLGLKRRAVA